MEPEEESGQSVVPLVLLAGAAFVAIFLILSGTPLSLDVGAMGGKAEKKHTEWGGSTKVPKGTRPCALKPKERNEACKKAKGYAYSKVKDEKQFKCLDELWYRESNWNAWAENPSSGASGIPQELGHGRPFELGDWKKQVNWGLRYIKNRPGYGNPCAAWKFWQRTDPRPYPGHWY